MSVIKNFVAKLLFKKRGAIANNKAVEFSAKDVEQRLRKFNIDPNTIKSEGELKQLLNFVQQAEDQAFIDRFGNMLQGSRFGKSADVLDMTGKKLDPNKGIMGGTQTTEETIKENLMKTDNPFSELVRATEKGPKTLKEREAEILERMNRENKEAAERIRKRQKERMDDMKEIEDPEDMAQGGRAGYAKGIGPLLRFLNENNPAQAYSKYLKSVKDRMKAGKEAEVAGEVIPIAGTGALITNQLKKKLKAMNEEEKKRIEKEVKEELKKDMEKRADGGRAGFDKGGAPSIVLNPEKRAMDKEFETSDVKEAIKEIIKRSIGPLDMAEIPISEKGRLRFGFDSSGNRQLTGGLDLLGGELNIGMGSGKQGKGVGLEFRKRFDKGGMSRRQFMKIMGGIASLPFIGKFFKGAKPAAKVAEVATKSMPAQPPEYFFDLAAKIKILGKESSAARRERMVEVNYKNYTLEEDLVTGDMTIVKRKGDPEFNYEEEVMVLRKGQADEMTKGTKPPDEYEELTVRPDPDGKMKDVEDGIEPESVKEIMEEVGQGGGNLDQTTLEEIARGKLASGGVAMMLGE